EGNAARLAALKPIFQTALSEKTAEYIGEPAGTSKQVVARPGYAVAGLRLSPSWGMQGVVMRLEGGTRVRGDTYPSPWLLGRGGEASSTLGGDGRPVIGLHGRRDGQIQALGLVLLDAQSVDEKHEPPREEVGELRRYQGHAGPVERLALAADGR